MMRHILPLTGVLLMAGSFVWLWNSRIAYGQSRMQDERIVRLAELDIDPAQLESYKAALQEEITESIRVEPGVLTLYAVSVKGQPSQVRIFEMYANEAAYRSHLETPHFTKYKAGTQGMVRALRLVETDPISLSAKPNR